MNKVNVESVEQVCENVVMNEVEQVEIEMELITQAGTEEEAMTIQEEVQTEVKEKIEDVECTKENDVMVSPAEVEAKKSKALKPKFYTAREILDMDLDNEPMLVENLMYKRELVSLVGGSGLGKSTMLFQLCRCIVTGKPFLDYKVNPTYHNAIFLSTEEGKRKLGKRLRAVEKELSEEQLANFRFVVDTTDHIARLEQLLSDKAADVVVIDTFGDVFGGEMNQMNQVRTHLTKYSQLGEKYGSVFIINHHLVKGAENGIPDKRVIVGSTGFEGKVRLVLGLWRDVEDRKCRHLCILKANDLDEDCMNESIGLDFDAKTGFSRNGNNKDPQTLGRPKEHTSNYAKAKEKALEYIKENQKRDKKWSLNEIQEKLKADGYSLGRTSIGDMQKKYQDSLN